MPPDDKKLLERESAFPDTKVETRIRTTDALVVGVRYDALAAKATAEQANNKSVTHLSTAVPDSPPETIQMRPPNPKARP